MEDLQEQKRINETALNQRGGLLSVLLHQTSSSLPAEFAAMSNAKLNENNSINIENKIGNENLKLKESQTPSIS